MSIVSIVNKENRLFRYATHTAIIIGMWDAWRRTRNLGNTPQEPDFVASLVLESTPIIYDTYQSIFKKHGLDFSLTSVYCHQTPKVKYKGISKTSCELGDLLFVHLHSELNGNIRRNALLYQAKVTPKQPHNVPPKEHHQLKLYTDWPEFEYHNSPPLTGKKRLVYPHSPHRGAQYLLIDGGNPSNANSGLWGYPGTYPFGSCIADGYLVDHNELASELVEFLVYRAGRAFGDQPKKTSNSGWTQTIWDLLDVSLKKVIKRKNSGRSTEPRISGGPLNLSDGLCFAQRTSDLTSKIIPEILNTDKADWLFSREGGPPKEENEIETDIEDSGISVIIFETSEFEE